MELINTYLIENGKQLQDPWIVCIGYWWKGQHFDAINILSSMIGETREYLAKQVFNKSKRFDLIRSENFQPKEEDEDSKTNAKSNKAETTKEADEWFEYPIISGRNVFIMDFVNQLLDHHIIKRELQKQQFEEESSEEEGGSIFDDFFGGSSAK